MNKIKLNLLIYFILLFLSLFTITCLISFNLLDSSLNETNYFYIQNILRTNQIQIPKKFISVYKNNDEYKKKLSLLLNQNLQNATELNFLKFIGRTDTVTHPKTKRQQLGAFSIDYNSSRYEEINCPDFPEPGYPKTYPMKQILDNWNPDDTTIPPFHYNSLCYFDYETELQKAINYRDAEVPFVVYNTPEVNEIVKKWNDLNYLYSKIGSKDVLTDTSVDNHFMYFNIPEPNVDRTTIKDSNGNQWFEPTTEKLMNFKKWVELAVFNHFKPLETRKHAYFRVSTTGPNHWLFHELPFFQPNKSLFMVNPEDQQGIHCRFGMNSIISESHFDGSRNYAITFSGVRRWILNHPNQCINVYMYPSGHPSERHSQIDWSKPNYHRYPRFQFAETNEIIVRPGDALYLPTYWLHYIISLNVNLQCNSRSGYTTQFDKMVSEDCGLQ